MKRHLNKNHSEILNEHERRSKREVYEADKNDKKIKFTIEMSVNDVINACISLLTKESVPLSFFDSDSFQTLTTQLFDGLKIPKINSKNVMTFVKEKCEKIKNKIQKLTSERMICLKIDTATRNDRAILGINVQEIIGKKIEIFTLAMVELKKKHTAENLKKEIENVLNSFKINKKQIYAITTDNGRNMVKAVELLSLCSEDDEENDNGREDNYENIVDNIAFDNIISIKCAAHTLQLAVKDFLGKLHSNVVIKSREIVKILRTPAFRYSIQSSNQPKPQMDVPTRWSSTYNMLKRLLELKGFCIEHLPAFEQLQSQEWIEIEEILKVLAPANTLTLKLQKSSLLLGDFYKFWLELIFELKDVNSDMSKQVLACIEGRQTKLLENDTVYAAIFLDPRFMRVLSQTKIEAAKNHLKKIVLQIQSVGNVESQHISNTDNFEEDSFLIDESSVASTSSLLRNGLKDMELNNCSSDDDDVVTDGTIQQAYFEIENYKEKRLDVAVDLLEYWESKKFTLPWLHKLALIVHSVPATQVSVERSFSALKLILGD